MTEPKHTPGPWRAEMLTRGSMWVHGADKSIVVCVNWESASDITSEAKDRHWSNTVLIAAAPDLLAALRLVEWRGSDGVEYRCPCCHGDKYDNGHYQECDLSIAIKKATI